MRKQAFRLVWVLYLAALMSLVTISQAAAYLDPGSGSLIFQVVVGGLMAASLAVKVFWRRIASLFKRRENRDDA